MTRRRSERKRVLILGGGFAGLAAALELRPDRHEVTLSSILRYSDKADLDPYSPSSRGALSLLEEHVDSAAIVSRESG